MVVGDCPRSVGKVMDFSLARGLKLCTYSFQYTSVWGCNPHDLVKIVDASLAKVSKSILSSLVSDLNVISNVRTIASTEVIFQTILAKEQLFLHRIIHSPKYSPNFLSHL